MIEMLVVIAIIGILSTFVAYSTAPSPARQAKADAKKLGLLLEAALQDAQWGGHGIAWSADGNGYRFWREGTERSWQPITDDPLYRPRTLPDGTAVSGVEIEGQPLPPGALLKFIPFAAPLFQITLSAPQGTLVLRSLPNGKVDVQIPSHQ